jgi:ketosteroid isomerase-like protein
MRIAVLALILTGLAAGSARLAPGQQQSGPSQPEIRHWRNLLGEVKALDEFAALRLRFLDAFDRHDAIAMTNFYVEDGIAVTPDGWFEGHDAIRQWYEFLFQRWQPRDALWQVNRLTGTDTEAWGIGQWWGTVQGRNGPVSASGYWSTEYVRVGSEWKIRSAAYNASGGIQLTPAPNASAGQ